MPGIVGLVSQQSPDRCQRLVHRMLDSMRHEPTYKSDFYAYPEAGVYAGWVAHDKSFGIAHNGFYPTPGVTLIMSGECYTDNPVCRIQHGEPRSSWIVEQYIKLGPTFIASLNGLFSGVLIDHRTRVALLFNDRFGMERLYVHESEGTTFFASEAKAILAVCSKTRALNNSALTDYLSFGCTLNWGTLFQGISVLDPASVWVFAPDRICKKDIFFNPSEWEGQPPLDVEGFETAFEQLFETILRRYILQTDSIGISLTGGIDTRMIMACLPKTSIPRVTYTFSGQSENILDAQIAGRIARSRGLEHHILRIDSEFLRDFGTMIDRSVFISDGCCGATGAHEIYFNRCARELAPIRLTGNFGSEVLRSISTFKPLRLEPRLLARSVRSNVQSAALSTSSLSPHPVTFAAFREIPWNLIGTVLTGRSQVTFRTPYLDNELVALAYRAPTGVRTSSVSALRFLERASPDLSAIPTDRGHIGTSRGLAWAMRRAFAEITFKLDYLHKEGLPSWLAPFDPVLDSLRHTGVLGLHKFLPYRRWFRKDLAPYVRDVVTDKRTRELSFLDASFLEPMLSDHSRGHKNYVREINAVLTLEAINRLLLQMPNDRVAST